MPMNEAAELTFASTMEKAHDAAYEAVAMMHFGFCHGLLTGAMLGSQIGMTEFSERMTKLNTARNAWGVHPK